MMRFVPQNEFFDSYKLSPSRIQWAARGAMKGAAKVGASASVVDSVEALWQMCRDYALKRRAWQAARNAEVDPDLAKSDYKVDRYFSNFVARVELDAEDFGADTARGKAAVALLDGPLNLEVFSVTNATREEEASMLAVIVEEIDAEYRESVRICGLEAHFALLQAALDTFVEQMHRTPQSALAPTTEQLKALAEQIYSKMIEVIHRANGAWPTTSKQDGVDRSYVLGPFAVQNDRAAAYYRRNNGSTLPEIDPETGEDLPSKSASDTPQTSNLAEAEPG